MRRLVAGAFFFFLTACGSNGTTPSASPTSTPTPAPTATPAIALAYSLQNGNEGSGPTGVIALDGVLYGTTSAGGTGFQGTVFRFVPGAAKATVLHSFTGVPDGQHSFGPPIAIDGALYGTTAYGGAAGRGTIFRIAPSGAGYQILYSFGATPTDGVVPFAGLTGLNGTIYGTAAGGGTHNNGGTVFSIAPSGSAYTTLHDFGAGTDGKEPFAPLTASTGTLYGTTGYGGTYGCALYVECGTIFEIDTAGNERVLHSFGKGGDGFGPQTGLLAAGGVLYGTTYAGGTTGNCHNGHGLAEHCGTVFSIATDGTKYAVLHDFGRGNDGMRPFGTLVMANGTLFGTTARGGKYGFGTVFAMSPDGSTYHVVYNFGASASDGQYPAGPLAAWENVIYGATQGGGADGSGTIFAITP